MQKLGYNKIKDFSRFFIGDGAFNREGAFIWINTVCLQTKRKTIAIT